MTVTKKKESAKKRKIFKKLFWTLFGLFFIASATAGYFFFDYVMEGIPSLEELENPETQLASNVYDCNGQLLSQFFKENRIETELDSIPKHLVDALIATEDREFYDHWGVNVERVFKALFKTYVLMGRRQGGSTITQQLAKNLFQLKNKEESEFETIVRKFREWITSVEIEKNYTKKEILEMYLNLNYLGESSYGVTMAARAYFNKRIQDLTIPESALIVALCNLPGKYNPYKNYDGALIKRNQILYNMVAAGYMSEEDYHKFKVIPIELSETRIKEGFNNSIAPHYVENIRRQLESMREEYGFDPYKDGLSIYTTIDSKMQEIANRVVSAHIDSLQVKFNKAWKWNTADNKKLLDDLLDWEVRSNVKDYFRAQTKAEKEDVVRRYKNNKKYVDSMKAVFQEIEVGFVVLDAKTSEIKAMVGGRTDFGRGLNHITNIKRQPGSAFKPIIYSVALDNGLFPAYPILNQPFEYQGWRPENFNKRYGGFMTIREGLTHSKNVISARLILEGHVDLYKVGQYARRMGISTKLGLYHSIALGTSEVYPIELAGVYQTLANKGIYVEPHSLKAIEDKDGILIEAFSPKTREALSAETTYLLVNMMEDVINKGSGSNIRYRSKFYKTAAGKTGTTQDYRNAWFAGFTPHLVGVVWVGFNKEQVGFECMGTDGQGGRAAAPLWGNFMREVYEQFEFPDERFERPASGEIVDVSFCLESIEDYGIPRVWTPDCGGEKYFDIIKASDVPSFYNATRDTSIHVFTKYMAYDSTSHEALEIIDSVQTIIDN